MATAVLTDSGLETRLVFHREQYHDAQIASFVAEGADRASFLTATHAGEAIGVVRAAVRLGILVVISFTVETDGQLPSGQLLHEAVDEVDAATAGAALHFGINCAHPDHFTAAIPSSSGRSTQTWSVRTRTCVCSVGAVARTPVTCARSRGRAMSDVPEARRASWRRSSLG